MKGQILNMFKNFRLQRKVNFEGEGGLKVDILMNIPP